MEQLEMYKILSYFLIYSFLGWGVEVAYQALSKGLVINRGFLNGPVCPIYGFGVVSILILLYNISDGHPEKVNAFGVFVLGVCISTAIELFGGWALDKLFHARWWDYRDRKFNLNGYICPEFSVYWGLGIVILIRIVHPFIYDFIFLRPVLMISWIFIILMYAIYFVDLLVSVFIMIGLNKRFAEIDNMQRKLRDVSDRLSEKIGNDTLERADRIEKIRDELQETKSSFYSYVDTYRHIGTGRMIIHNPSFDSELYQEQLAELRKSVNKQRNGF